MGKIKSFLKRYLSSVYYIGFLDESDLHLNKEDRFKKIHWLGLKGYKGGWFADPFFLSVSKDKVQLLVEEWRYSQNKGIISLLDIDVIGGQYTLKSITPLLELPTHLSFPNIWREEGKIYVYPENWREGGVKMYELDVEKKKLVNPVLIVDKPLADSSILNIDGSYYLMGTHMGDKIKDSTKSVEIYVANKVTGPYKYYQTITNIRRIERGAGEIYNDGDYYIRPVQKCEKYYGESVIINKLTFEGDRFREEIIAEIEPDMRKRRGIGLHTLNKMNGICVIDGKDYRYPIIGRLYNQIKKRIKG